MLKAIDRKLKVFMPPRELSNDQGQELVSQPSPVVIKPNQQTPIESSDIDPIKSPPSLQEHNQFDRNKSILNQNTVFSANSVAIANPPKKLRKKLYIYVAVSVVILAVIVGTYFAFFGKKVGNPNDSTTWVKYTYSDLGFSSLFVAKPDYKTEDSRVAKIYIYLSKDDTNQFVYGVIVVKPTNPSSNPSKDIDDLLNGMVKTLSNAKVTSKRTSMINNLSVTDVSFTGLHGSGQQQTWVVRFIPSKDKIYQISTLSVSSSAAPNTEDFIRSFQLL